jgi:hypothetical protein
MTQDTALAAATAMLREPELSMQELAIRVFNSEENADRWLDSPNMWLGGESPKALIASGHDGMMCVETLIKLIGEARSLARYRRSAKLSPPEGQRSALAAE